MKETLHEIVQTGIVNTTLPVFEVYNCFVDFYGEEFVDINVNIEELKESFLTDKIRRYFSYDKGKLFYNTDITESQYANSSLTLGNPSVVWNKESAEVLQKALPEIITRKLPENITILVHFPEVKVTNENDKFTYIQDVFVKVIIDRFGKAYTNFRIGRATYSKEQYDSRYLHSHINGIPSDPSVFLDPCLGSGPIRGTLGSLYNNNDPDLWKLFCFELSTYLRTESIRGTPYMYLEKIKTANNPFSTRYTPEIVNIVPHFTQISKEFMSSFVKYVFENSNFKYRFDNNKIMLGMSDMEYLITLSNLFIQWYNENYNSGTYRIPFNKLIEYGIIDKYIIDGNKVFLINSRSSRNRAGELSSFINKAVCKFKGKTILSKVIDDQAENTNFSILLNFALSNYILTKILKIINYKYSNNGNILSKESDTSAASNNPNQIIEIL